MSWDKFSDKPMKDEWDIVFLKYVRDKADDIISAKMNEENTKFREYHKRYTDIEWYSRGNRGKKKYLGLIARSENEADLRYAVERKINNRASVQLTDLHELYLCSEISPNTLFNIRDVETIVQLQYLTESDIQNLSKYIDRMPGHVPFVVQCVPLLGLYLTTRVKMDNGKKRLLYEIVDTFGIFSWTEHASLEVKHIFPVPDPPMDAGIDFKMERTIKSIYKNALHIFDEHCSLAKGILSTYRSQPIDRYNALPKNKNESELPIRKIASFLSIDSVQKISNRGCFTTDSKMLEKTIESFMRDVDCVYKKQREYEEMVKHQEAQEKKEGKERGIRIDSSINNSADRSRNKTKKKCE